MSRGKLVSTDPLCWRMIHGIECKRRRSEHEDGRCPSDGSRKFRDHGSTRGRASGSFREDELRALEQLCRVAMLSPDTRNIGASPQIARVLSRVKAMRASIARRDANKSPAEALTQQQGPATVTSGDAALLTNRGGLGVRGAA